MNQPLLLTPNERQALSLREAYDRERQAAGETVWETLPASSWKSFLRLLWDERALAAVGKKQLPSLMNPWQERFLWMRVISESPQGEILLNLAAAGRLAAEAQRIVGAFELADALAKPPIPWEEETQAFLGWAQTFQATCRRQGWLDSSRLEAELTSALESQEIPTTALPSEIELVGFSELSPSQSRLLAACSGLGIVVRQRSTPPESERPGWCRTVAEDAQGELRLAARWIRHLLETAPPGKPPKIGLVIPELASGRATVTRILDEVLQPSQLLHGSQGREPIYNISLGLPLIGWPVIADALSLLNIEGRWQPLSDYGVLFHSPFVAGAETERGSRALLEASLLRAGAYQVTLSRIAERARPKESLEDLQPAHSRLLARCLDEVLAHLAPAEATRKPSLWAAEFAKTLKLYGWPGERLLDSAEFQTVARWGELLSHLGSLDRVEPSLTRREAVAILRRMAEETVFQPKLATGTVEVLGYLEAAGLNFDYLWVMGMHDGAWPQSARPNPYLPATLQRAHGVPHSSADRELEFARRLTAELVQGAERGVVSNAAFDGEQALRTSLLVESLAPLESKALSLSPLRSPHREMFESQEVELIQDPGPPSVGERHSMGGTSIFKLQSACAFRAFASLRTHCRPLDAVEAGLNEAQRGNLVHHVLESFWKRARTSRALHDWPEGLLEEVVAEAVEEALLRSKRDRPDVLYGAFLDLERDRLIEFTHRWLELEATREPFVVRDTERKVELEFGGVKFKVIVDRVDRLQDGRLAMIDYKTGNVKVGSWFGERPEEPQLPLYCVANPEEISALVYGRIQAGKFELDGISETADMLPGVNPSEQAGELGQTWEARQEQWREVLARLAEEFFQGRAEVDPLKRRTTCRHCKLESLCRVDELEARR